MDSEISRIFNFQYNYNPVYRQYVDMMGFDRFGVDSVEKIPFLPISFFKRHKIITSADEAVSVEKVFTSSATTGVTPSSHYVADLSLYEKSFLSGFEQFYGKPSNYAILALLPSYLERDGSSLVYMVERLIKESNCSKSGFYLYNHNELLETLIELLKNGQRVMLIGVTFALLDFAEHFSIPKDLSKNNLIIMETGGMKGKRGEMPREEVHKVLKQSFQVESIHSEYGMCELLSQAYSCGDGIFRTPSSMRVLVRDFIDPLKVVSAPSKPMKGAINIIDTANIYSCSFIQTEDVGTLYPDGSFTIEGRLEGAQRRGCNMLIE